MRINSVMTCMVLAASVWCIASASAADRWGLSEGSPELKSAGPLTFGPDGILFVGDTKGATIFAIATDETSGDPSKVELNVAGLNEKIASLLGASPGQIAINDLAVNPLSGSVYLSVAKSGTSASPAAATLVRVDAAGKVSEVPLKKVHFSSATLPNAPEDKVVEQGRRRGNPRDESITDLAYIEGKLIVSGLAQGSSPSNVREIPFPFIGTNPGSSIEIYHGAHGRTEDYAVVRAFVPFTINGEPTLLAGFTCTPLVKFPVNSLAPGETVRGTTIAELGNRNRPLDMIVYQKDGKDYLLMANSARGVMKISTDNIAQQEAITQRIPDGRTAGLPYETIDDLQGVVQLDRLNDENAIVLVQTEGGSLDLRTVPLP